MHLGLGTNSRSAAQQQQQPETRDARRVFRESVRDDWDYPPLPAYQTSRTPSRHSSSGARIAGFKVHQSGAQDITPHSSSPEILQWREREYGSSDSDDDDDPQAVVRRMKKAKEKAGGYMFEGPDSVGEEVSKRRLARKRKRQRDLEEEVVWNEGLRHWLMRRTSWTGAKSPTRVRLLQTCKQEPTRNNNHDAMSTSMTPSPRSSTSVHSDATGSSSQPSTTTTSPDSAAVGLAHVSIPPPSDLLIPVMAPILPTHPIRKKIGPGMYSEIYNKIILQSRTPHVPVNLLNLTRALVHGWKADGEWPPKASAPEPSVRRKRGTGLKEGVRAVTRVLKIGSADPGGTTKEVKEGRAG